MNLRFFHQFLLPGAVAGVLLAGCGNPSAPPQNSPQSAAPSGASSPMASAPMASAPNSSSPGAPMMGAAQKLAATPGLDAKIAQLATGKDKKALAAALTARGDAKMNDAGASPRLKYRAALADYNRALGFDPKNQGALEAKATIENIYKMMGRPVPKD